MEMLDQREPFSRSLISPHQTQSQVGRRQPPERLTRT